MTAQKTKSTDRVRELEALCGSYIAELSRLEARVAELSSENARLNAELQRRRGVRMATHGLYRALDDAIIARIDRRGFARKPKKRVELPIPEKVLASGDRLALMKLAREYDAVAYFRYKASGSGMRLQYRVASKVYRIGRDAAVLGLKKTYRLARKVVK